MDIYTWDKELSLFAEDLIVNLLSRLPVLHTIPHKLRGSPYFKEEISKCVLLIWWKRRNELEQNLKSDYPAFVETKQCFEQYLKRFVDVEVQKEHSVINQILGMSAVLLEILFFVYRQGMTQFVHNASSYLFFMLSNVKVQKFHEEGGWSYLASVSAKQSEDYDEEMFRKYISNICNISASESLNSNIGSTLACPIETSAENSFQPDNSMFHEEKCENNSTEEGKTLVEVTEKHSQEVVSILSKSEDEPGRDSTNEEITAGEVKHFPEVVSTLNKHEDKTENNFTIKEVNSSEVTDKNSKEVVFIFNKPEDEREKDSTNNKITPDEVKHSQEVVSIFNKPENETEKDSTNNKITPDEVKHSQEVVLIFNKPEDETEKDSTNTQVIPYEVKEKHSQDVVSILKKSDDKPKNDSANKVSPNAVKDGLFPEAVKVSDQPEEKPNKNSTKIDSMLSETITEIKGESLKHPNILRKEPPITLSSDLTGAESNELCTDVCDASDNLDVFKPSTDFTGSSIKTNERKTSPDSHKSSAENITHSMVNFVKMRDCNSESFQTNPTDCEINEELDKFLIEEITTNFQVRFLTKDEEIEAMLRYTRDDFDIPPLVRDAAVQANLVPSENNQNIRTLEHLPTTALLSTEIKSIAAAVQECIIDNDTKKDSSLKSPKCDLNKKATPNKVKTPSAEKCGVKDTKNKTETLNYNENVTPVKIQTPNSSHTFSGRKPGAKTPNSLNSNSTVSKSSSPCFKTAKGVPKIQLKSCEKTEPNRNVLPSKVSIEITKSSPKSTSATNAKSRKEELSDSSKTMHTTVQPKLGEKDLLHNLKSSTSSESIPKGKVHTTDISTKGKTTNPKTENCQKNASREQMAGSSAVELTNQSEGNTPKNPEESLDTKSCKEKSSHVKKCDQIKGNEPPIAPAKITTSCRTRTVIGKNASTDSKSEKPRWR